MNRNNVFNFVLFVVLAGVILGGWWVVDTYFLPKPPPPTPPTKPEPKPARETLLALTGGTAAGSVTLADWPSAYKPKADPKPDREAILALTGGLTTRADSLKDWPTAFRPTDATPHRLIGLSGAGYNLQVLLTNRGAGVQQVVLPAFDQASRGGRPATDNDKPDGNRYPLELVPGYHRPRQKKSVLEDGPRHVLAPTPAGETVDPAVPLTEPSYTILHYDRSDSERPSDELATRKWEVVSERAGSDAEPGEVVFETTLGAPHFVRVRKTFGLSKSDYHVRMKLEFFAAADRPGKGDFFYQICGARNLPVEGEWYTGTLRNAMVGWKEPNGTAKRDIQDAAHITTEYGGTDVKPQGNTFTFAAVVNQFFASAVAIDPDQLEQLRQEQRPERRNLWRHVRATREWTTTPPDAGDSREEQARFYQDKPQLGDITVRAAAHPIDPSAGRVEHRYWLYHGPTKVRLLNSLDLLDDQHQIYSTDRNLVEEQYVKALGLNTMTDAPSPNWFGAFAAFIHWTDLVVLFTDLMHGVLGWMHKLVPVWVLNIIMLTVMVRLILMLPSRRQQASMMKMQDKMAAMKPELTKLQEKYKADPQRLNQEKTKLMLAHGVNPLSSLGGCLLMFAQMPVFLGLYYCLQESIFFRLHGSPGWVPNLAAPDMLIGWTESIPFISSPNELGKTWYLGPYFNLLPVVAVALMYLNFKISSPPPTDEQQAMQQKTMKFMMIFMGVFFYKMAAGLCVYFIVSTLWGIIERKLLKKKKKADDANGLLIPGGGPSASAKPNPNTPPAAPGFWGRVKQGLMEKLEEAQKQGESQGRQIINDPKPPPKPPPGGTPPQGGFGQGGKGKKKRKKK